MSYFPCRVNTAVICSRYTVKNNPVKKTVNYLQLWLPASYRNYTVCYCFCVKAYSC